MPQASWVGRLKYRNQLYWQVTPERVAHVPVSDATQHRARLQFHEGKEQGLTQGRQPQRTGTAGGPFDVLVVFVRGGLFGEFLEGLSNCRLRARITQSRLRLSNFCELIESQSARETKRHFPRGSLSLQSRTASCLPHARHFPEI